MNVLTLAYLLFTAPLATDPCTVPSGYTHLASRTEADVKYTLAVDETEYVRFQTINFYYVIENTGDAPATFSFEAAEQYTFRVYPDSCQAVDEPGCYEAAIYAFPQVVHAFASEFTLQPGECKVFSRSWDQRRNTSTMPAPGAYRVFGGLYEPDSGPSFGTITSGTELTLDIEILDATTPTENATWGRVKALFEE